MALYLDVPSEKSDKLKAISDEIGKITRKLIDAAENRGSIAPEDELRLKELNKELESLSRRKPIGSHGSQDPGANPRAL